MMTMLCSNMELNIKIAALKFDHYPNESFAFYISYKSISVSRIKPIFSGVAFHPITAGTEEPSFRSRSQNEMLIRKMPRSQRRWKRKPSFGRRVWAVCANAFSVDWVLFEWYTCPRIYSGILLLKSFC